MNRCALGMTCGVGAAFAWVAVAQAWIFSEHRDITVDGFEKLDVDRRAVLEELWKSAVLEAPGGALCDAPVDARAETVDTAHACVDFGAMTALAADHACSLDELWETAAHAPWVNGVLEVAAQTKRSLAAAKDKPPEQEQAWVLSNFALQAADPKYLSRAQTNYAHFLLPRRPASEPETLDGYLDRCLNGESLLNAIGLYARLHSLALHLAAQRWTAPAQQREALARRALLAEASGLHFLEDGFSAGHYAGTWGDNVWRKGTHDYYSANGLATVTWGGKLFESHGDAHMTAREQDGAGDSVRRSLEQLADAARGLIEAAPPEDLGLEDFDVCRQAHLDAPPLALRTQVLDVIRQTPMPSGGEDSIHPPRMRAEVGPFAGVVASTWLGAAFDGYETQAGSFRARETLEVALRTGYSLEGFLTSGQDGMIWAQASFVADPPQLDATCTNCPGGARGNTGHPRVEARSSIRLAVRMPFWVVPGDLIVLGPLLALANPGALQRVVFDATAGGLIPWQRRVTARIGTFQLILGREVALTPNGYIGTALGLGNNFQSYQAGQYVDVPYKSLELDFPVLEYTPTRLVQTQLAIGAVLQLGATVELEKQVAPRPHSTYLGPSYLLYLRLSFEGRRYF